MAAITWRNVDAPNLGDPTRTLGMAQQSFNNVFDSLGKVLDRESANVDYNWKQGSERNTDSFLSQLQQRYKTPEEYAAAQASGEVDALRSSFGAKIQAATARDAMANMGENLQRKVTTRQMYENAQADNSERALVGQAGQLIAAGDKEGFAAFKASNPNLRPSTMAKLETDWVNAQRGYSQEARAEDANDRGWLQLDLQEKEIKARQEAEAAQAQARVAEAARLKMTDLKSQLELEKAPVQRQLDLAEAALKNSPFAGKPLGTSESEAAIKDAVKNTGISMFSPANVDTFWTKTLDAARGAELPASSTPFTRVAKDNVVNAFSGMYGPIGMALATRATTESKSPIGNKYPHLTANGKGLIVYERDENGKVMVDPKTKQTKAHVVPLTTEMAVRAINEAKGTNFSDPSPEDVARVLQKMSRDPTLLSESVSYMNSDMKRVELQAKLGLIEDNYAKGGSALLFGAPTPKK